MIAAYAETVRVVVNGSATPKVIGSLPSGRGALAICSSALFCQKQTASAMPKKIRQMMIRLRSSSRCSTSVRRSSKSTGLIRATTSPVPGRSGLVVGDDLALDGLG